MCLVDGRGYRRQEQSNDVITVCVKNLVDICSLLSSEMIRESTRSEERRVGKECRP